MTNKIKLFFFNYFIRFNVGRSSTYFVTLTSIFLGLLLFPLAIIPYLIKVFLGNGIYKEK